MDLVTYVLLIVFSWRAVKAAVLVFVSLREKGENILLFLACVPTDLLSKMPQQFLLVAPPLCRRCRFRGYFFFFVDKRGN